VEIAEARLATAAQWKQNCASASGFSGGPPSKVRVGLAPEWLGDASRPDSRAQNRLALVADRGEGLRHRLGLVDQFAREELLFIGGIHLLVADAETNSILSPI
jgi:hypothetical protein